MLRDACSAGEIALAGGSVPTSKTPDRLVRSEAVRFLALGGDESALVHEHGVQLQGAWIEGVLDLSGCDIHAKLCFTDCHFEEAPSLNDASCKVVKFDGSHLPGLRADWVRVSGSLSLRQTVVKGEIRLLGADIRGDLDCEGAKFTCAEVKDCNALTCDTAVIKGSMLLRGGVAKGKVRLLGTNIGGNLECDKAKFFGADKAKVIDADNGDRDAIWSDGMVVKGDVFLRGIQANGEVRLLGSRIGGNLECDGSSFTGVEDGKRAALTCDRAVVSGHVYLRKEFVATGEVRLLGIDVGGNLECDYAKFFGDVEGEQDSLSLDRATISGNVFFSLLRLQSFANWH